MTLEEQEAGWGKVGGSRPRIPVAPGRLLAAEQVAQARDLVLEMR
jgi:hypothetical protein